MQEHELFMRRCLDLAALGLGSVSPNPLVGAMLVHQGKIIAENYHRKYGEGHAEALLIQDILERYGDKAAAIFQESTLYVTLEPCAHHGKTPPCADLIVKHRIPHVVIALQDPFEQVNGQGTARLREAGIRVETGVLEEEARWQNRRFLTKILKNRPYIILKWAQTADGFMAPEAQEQKWITGAESKQLSHRWRSEEDAILVGSGTVRADNPRLDVRLWEGRNPKRILIDKNLSIAEDAAIFNPAAETIVFNAMKSDWQKNKKLIELENFDLYLPQQIMYQLFLMDIQSVIVEGGIHTLNLFIKAGLWDEARVLQSPSKWGKGRKAPEISGTLKNNSSVGKDQLLVYIN